MLMTYPAQKTQTLSVYLASDFIATDGVAEGESLSFADELVLDDTYALNETARRSALRIGLGPRLKSFRVLEGSVFGAPGHVVHMDCCITLMNRTGQTCDALVLVEVDNDMAVEIYLLPLADLAPTEAYQLVGIDRHAATRRFAEAAYVSFGRGTRITLASGRQVPVEELSAGDMILTRDGGPRPLRWIGQTTVRASGALAPVCIQAGTLSNSNDLILSPDHRVFVYQREDHLGAGTPEVLVKARHLINGTTVTQKPGGFVDYFQLLFDDHQMIYAEGIVAESLRITPRTRDAVPEEVAQQVLAFHPLQPSNPLEGYEVTEALMSAPDAVDLLKRASSC